MKKNVWFLFIVLLGISCSQPKMYDCIIKNATIYTVDDSNPWAEALGIKDGIIVAVGSMQDIIKGSTDSVKVIDCKGGFLMPGFIEGHGHFEGLGDSQINLNFLKSRSWNQIVKQVEEKLAVTTKGDWIIGRGWHQEKWDSISNDNIDGYPQHHSLSKISPDNPIVLYHASGHSLFANKMAMDAAGINIETLDPMGGKIIRNFDGNAIGVFEERAMGAIKRAHTKYLQGLSQKDLDDQWYHSIDLAQKECLKNGITSFQDAGSSFDNLSRYDQLAKEGKLDIRLWVMLRHKSEEMLNNLLTYRKIGVGNNFYTCRAIKTEIDGALGSFGAWLIDEYDDKPGFYGQNTTELEEVEAIAKLAKDANMQLCIHAIGDRANRESLNIIEKYNPDNTNHRWRIEHAQHLDTADIKRFSSSGTIALMQGIHCTSDAPFVEKRLGHHRSKFGAYPWRSLIDAGAMIVNGTDAPVEDVDPIPSFYASVTRQRIDNGFEFFPEQSMSRKEAIASYTINAAFAAFEEDIKGSIEIGKVADFVLLSNNLITCTDKEILDTKVIMTVVDGEIKYEFNKSSKTH